MALDYQTLNKHTHSLALYLQYWSRKSIAPAFTAYSIAQKSSMSIIVSSCLGLHISQCTHHSSSKAPKGASQSHLATHQKQAAVQLATFKGFTWFQASIVLCDSYLSPHRTSMQRAAHSALSAQSTLCSCVPVSALRDWQILLQAASATRWTIHIAQCAYLSTRSHASWFYSGWCASSRLEELPGGALNRWQACSGGWAWAGGWGRHRQVSGGCDWRLIGCGKDVDDGHLRGWVVASSGGRSAFDEG